jgi:Fe-S-cluster containining protein
MSRQQTIQTMPRLRKEVQNKTGEFLMALKSQQGKKARAPGRDLKIVIRKLEKALPPFKKCRRCGECCGPLLITTPEYVKVIKELSRTEQFPQVAKNLLRIDKTATGDNRYTCPLLLIEGDINNINNRTTKCMIYKKRPIICRAQAVTRGMPCEFDKAADRIELRPAIKEYINQWVIQDDIRTGKIETIHVKARTADEKKPFTLCRDCLWDCYSEQQKGAIGCYDDEPHELIFEEEPDGTEEGQG